MANRLPPRSQKKRHEPSATVPALLGYYTCDELPNQMIPEMTERRNMLNRLDPEHPVWIVGAGRLYNRVYETLWPRGGYHRLRSLSNQKQSFDQVHGNSFAENCGSRSSILVVPQMFNFRRYFPATAQAETFRFPSANEFRSMILLAARL